MSKSAKTILVYGIYAIGAGLGFLFNSKFFLSLFGFEPASDHWIRIVAILILGIGYYYISSARAEDKHFFNISWKGRIWFFTASSMLAVFNVAPWNYSTNRHSRFNYCNLDSINYKKTKKIKAWLIKM